MKTRYSKSLALKSGNSYKGEGRLWFERNDCSVIAFAYAFNIDYSKAHELCKKAGRFDCKGFNLKHLFRVRTYKKIRTFLGHRIGYHGRPKMTVGRFHRNHMTGTYIIHVGHHAFAMIDGIIFNQGNDRDIISEYFYISKPKIKSQQEAA